MQEKRKDPKFRFNEDLRRIMRRVQTEENYRPNHKTFTKYRITNEEINEIREQRNWEPITIFIPPTYKPTPASVIQAEINEDTKLRSQKLPRHGAW